MPVPHHSDFTGWMPFLPPNQQCQSIEAKQTLSKPMKQDVLEVTWQIRAEVVPGVRSTEVHRVIGRSSQAVIGEQNCQ